MTFILGPTEARDVKSERAKEKRGRRRDFVLQ